MRGRKTLVLVLTFPHHEDIPPQLPERGLGLSVSLPIPLELWQPVVGSALRLPCQAAANVLMPEAAMNEDDLSQPGKDQIGSARQITAVQAEPVSQAMSRPPDRELRLRVRLCDAPHLGATLFWRNPVGHVDALGAAGAGTRRGAGLHRRN